MATVAALLICLLFVGRVAKGQLPGEWVLREELNANNGLLPQNSVRDLYFDSHTGFLWISTEAGLTRYNGHTVFTFDSRSLPGLQSPRFRKFYKCIDGKIAVTNMQELFSIEQNTLAFADTVGNIFGSYFAGSFVNFNTTADNPAAFIPSPVLNKTERYDFSIGPFETYWINEKDYITINSDSIYYISSGDLKQTYSNRDAIPASFFTLDNGLYARTTTGSVYAIAHSPFTVMPAPVDSLVAHPRARFFPNMASGKPLLLIDKKLYALNRENNKISATLFAILPSEIPDLSSIDIHPGGQYVYCGSLTHGLYIFSKPNFYTYAVPPEAIPALEAARPMSQFGFNNLYSSVLLADSTRVLTTEIILFDLATGRFKYPGSDNINRLQNYSIGRNSYLWGFGTTVSYITTLENGKAPTTSIRNNQPVNYFSRDADGQIWAFYKNGVGLFAGDSIRMIPRPFHLPDSILSASSDPAISVLGPAGDNKFMISWNHYLYTLDTATMSFQKYDDLPPYIYRAYIRENDRYYWLCTYGNGILLYDIKNKKTYPAPIDSRNYLLYAHTLAPDSKGNFLVPTNKGLFRINKQRLFDDCLRPGRQLLFEYYDTKHGLKDVEFNGGCIPAYNILPDKDVLFPSISGLVRVFNSALPAPARYPLFIENIRSNNTSRQYRPGITFASNERTQTWSVNFAHWSNTAGGNIFYRVDEGKWQTSESPSFTLSELGGGEHVLEIKVQFDLEGKEVSATSFGFYVAKRYYEQLWFWIIAIAGIVGLIILFSQLRNYQIKQKNIQLASKVEERTAQLEVQKELLVEKNTTLEHTLGELKTMMELVEEKNDFQKKMIRIIGHDVMIPLQYISKTANQLTVYKDKLSAELKEETIVEINTTSASLVFLGQSIIQWIKMQEDSFRPELSDFNVLQSLQDIILLHKKLLASKNNRLDIKIDAELSFFYDPVAFRIIIHNLLTNANKFTANGVITIECFSKDFRMYIIVSDTGKGMSQKTLESLNAFQPVSSAAGTVNEAGWGLGYKVIFDLVRAAEGTLHIESSPGNGTRVNISLQE